MTRTVPQRWIQQKPPRSYRAYGLSVTSHVPLSCFPRTDQVFDAIEFFEGSKELFFHTRHTAPTRPNPNEWFSYRRLEDGSDYLSWKRLGEFVVSADGRKISCLPSTQVSLDTFQTYLISQVLSFAMVKLKIEPLHATAVLVKDHAVAFLGNCGQGKSSLGAAFLKAGHRLLTDDLLVIKKNSESEKEFLAYPGPPRIKLYPKTATSLFGKRLSGVPMNARTKKFIIPLHRQQSSRTPIPLRTIYVLKPPSSHMPSKRITMTHLPQHHAILHLIAHTFNHMVVDSDRLAGQFTQAGQLAKSIPVKTLTYPRHLRRLPEVIEAIISDLAL